MSDQVRKEPTPMLSDAEIVETFAMLGLANKADRAKYCGPDLADIVNPQNKAPWPLLSGTTVIDCKSEEI